MITEELPTTDRLAALAGTVETELRKNILPFWLGLRDSARGGFFGAASSRGRVLPSAPKGAVLHARILWVFSAAYLRFSDPTLLDAADFAYRFIAEHLVDPVAGGVFWTASADGAPADRRKHLYAQAFAIYGLVAFHRASGERGALELAQQLWRVVEREAVDPKAAGYFEAFSPDWRIASNELMGRAEAPKTFNAHFHLFEAYSALWDVWPDPALRRRLEMLTTLLTGPLLDRRRNTFRQFFEADWRSLDEGFSNGHDIEASWLIPTIADRLSPELSAAAREAVYGVADAVLDRAVEADGGVLTGISPDGGVLTGISPDGRLEHGKVWWVQAEALVGFLDAFERQREMRFLSAAEGVWGFIERFMIDRAGGEWRWLIVPAGLAQPALPKANIWKCPYHNGRACFEVLDRAARLALPMRAPPGRDP